MFRRPLLVALLAGLLVLSGTGCAKRRAAATRPEPPLTPDTPLVIALNNKSQIRLGDRWYDLYGQRRLVDEYLRQQKERYRKVHEQYGMELPKVHMRSGETLECLTVPVIIEIEPKLKKGVLVTAQGRLKEHGFVSAPQIRPLGGDPYQMAGY
jgi:hypothetical protein